MREIIRNYVGLTQPQVSYKKVFNFHMIFAFFYKKLALFTLHLFAKERYT